MAPEQMGYVFDLIPGGGLLPENRNLPMPIKNMHIKGDMAWTVPVSLGGRFIILSIRRKENRGKVMSGRRKRWRKPLQKRAGELIKRRRQ